jgi:hypothetical protein
MKTIPLCIAASLFTVSSHAELAIIGFRHNALLSWTNSVSNAVYRIESAPSLAGPWSIVTNLGSIQASNQQVVVQLPPPGAQQVGLFRVVWADAPPAQPVGDWEYRGFDPSGGLTVTGLVSIAASNPVSGTCTLQAAGADPPPTHPVGLGSFTNGVVLGSNYVRIPLPTGFLADNFQASGPMALNEFWGWWSYTDVWFDLSGHSKVITFTGRFSAKRTE